MRQQNHEQYRGFRAAGIRLREPQLPELAPHRSDRALPILYGVHQFDKAHLVMLAEEGLIPRQDAVVMLRTLRETDQEGFEKARLKAGGGLHSAEYLLIQRHGEQIGGNIALGRSSGDLGVVSTRIIQRDALHEIMAGLIAVRSLILAQAEAHAETVMPGYTYGQHAQPTTLGHQLIAWASVLERDFERAMQAYGRINVSPAGGAIMTGSDFALDRERTAELLGFAAPITNTFDAILNHDTLLDSFSVLAIMNANLARLATDLVLWSSSEFGMVRIPDQFCSTSSIMTQTRNPGLLHMMNGVGASSVGALVTAFQIEKGPTGMAILERQVALESLARLQQETIRDLRLWQLLLPALEWNTGLMRERAGGFWAQATDVAGALVRECSVSWRTAHQITGILVRYSEERGMTPSQVTTAMLDEAAIEYLGKPAGLSDASLQQALDPRHFVESRVLHGGPAPDEVRRQAAALRTILERDEADYARSRQRVEQAAAKLEAAIDALLAPDDAMAAPTVPGPARQ